MDSIQLAHINEANSISTSGRWKAFNDKIIEIAKNPTEAEKWTLQAIAPLCNAVFWEYLELKRAYEDKQKSDVALLAWRSRNLFELSIWCAYCCRNPDNARRFYEDEGRDALELMGAFVKWGHATNQDSEWIESFIDAESAIRDTAQNKGIDSLDGPYKRIRDAAEECGFLDHFKLTYKFLSKFAHPTAFQILGNLDAEGKRRLSDLLFSEACMTFVGAFSILEEYLGAQE